MRPPWFKIMGSDKVKNGAGSHGRFNAKGAVSEAPAAPAPSRLARGRGSATEWPAQAASLGGGQGRARGLCSPFVMAGGGGLWSCF